jgi:hypothetical protein
MRVVLPLVGVLLAGCQSLADLEQKAPNASNFQICRAVMLAPGDVANIARREAARRSLDCSPYAQAVLQQENANQAATNAAVQRLLAPQQPQPMMIPNPVHCHSVQSGSVVNTTCR